LAAGREGVLICRDYYALLYNEAREQADWVAYKITPEMIKGNAKRKNNFKPDPLVPEGSAHPNDYKKTVFDRGHLMPAASCKFNQKAMDETFYMSNISPQYNYFNRGIWRLIEIQIRDWAVELGALYIVTGPAAYFPDSVIGKNQVSVPSHYYKVVMIDDSISVHMAGFLLKNEKSSLRPRDYLVSVDSVEVFTGLDFFPELADSIESEAEHKIDTLFQRK
jgi:endonuclease G